MKKRLIAGNLEIWYKDLPKRNWGSAKALSSALKGGNWRLPTDTEIKYLYDLHKLGILGFNPNGFYWTSNETSNYEKAISFNFNTGKSEIVSKWNILSIRPVRNV